MGVGTLTDRAAGQTILEGFFNDINSALKGDFVGRDASSGVPASGKSLGTAAFPWGAIRANSLVLNGSVVDTSKIISAQNRIISGAVRALSNQPLFLDPAGAAGGASFTLLGATTNLVVDINGSEITFTTDIVKSSLALAPSSLNTALVNDTDAADQESTRVWGELNGEKTEIIIDTVGSEITTLNGTIQSFKINDGATDEYFLAEIDTSNSRLRKIQRGYYSDAAGNPINRIKFANNDVITLMKTHWVFVDADAATVDTTTKAPIYSFTSPSSPVSGDYWFDIDNKLWKRYDGVSFVIINRTLVGTVICDDTDCIAARSYDFDAQYEMLNTMTIDLDTTEIAESRTSQQRLNVAGQEIQFGTEKAVWNITTDLATAADMYDTAEQVSRAYYLYVTDRGEEKISDISPYFREEYDGAWYHPHNPWRCVAITFNDGSSDLVAIASKGDSYKMSASSGVFSTNSTTPVVITNLSHRYCSMGLSPIIATSQSDHSPSVSRFSSDLPSGIRATTFTFVDSVAFDEQSQILTCSESTPSGHRTIFNENLENILGERLGPGGYLIELRLTTSSAPTAVNARNISWLIQTLREEF